MQICPWWKVKFVVESKIALASYKKTHNLSQVPAGSVAHGDSLGNQGAMGAGDVQWMTAGRGILHQEMPEGDADGRMHGFQLWANLPQALKMSTPRYQDVESKDLPEITDDDGTHVRIVCGEFWGQRGPVDGVAADPRLLDVSVPAGQRKVLPVDTRSHAFAYIFEGSGSFTDASDPQAVRTEVDGVERYVAPQEAGNRSLIRFGAGDEIVVQAGERGVRFLFVSGQPIQEPVAWRGPIVMNSQEELAQAYKDLRDGTFIQS